MKKGMWLIIGSILCVIIGIGYYIFYDNLPPRTPLKIARLRSGLDIPREMKIADFKEVYSSTGEGEIYVLLKMDETTLENIVQKCKQGNYKKLTVENLLADKLIDASTMGFGYNIHGKDITLIKEGYYRLEAYNLMEMDFCITVLDVEKKELIIYVSFP
jgi:hypothetical protein